MQPVDLTTLIASYCELRTTWLPARLEQVYQRDRHTIFLALRTLTGRGWLAVSWHPTAARLHLSDPPPRKPDTFTFSDQLRHQLGGLAFVAIAPVSPWERALDLQFAKRPGDPILWHLYIEIMGKRSNAILANADNQIVTAAHQVSEKQSSIRPILTGAPYALPPSLTDPIPSLTEPQSRWQERIALIPDALGRQMLKSYQGLSSHLVKAAIASAKLDFEQSTHSLTPDDWNRLFDSWQHWLKFLQTCQTGDLSAIYPHWTDTGYQVINWNHNPEPPDFKSVQDLLNRYYTDELNRFDFKQLRHQLSQKLSNLLNKLRVKAQGFENRLQESSEADEYRAKADLLMANLHEWQPGMKAIALPDFETGKPVTIPLDLEKNAVQNAQSLYKRHQKLKRARGAVEPLLAAVRQEIDYLEQIEVAISQIDDYREPADLQALAEIREEFIQQGYLNDPDYKRQTQESTPEFYRFVSPSGFELLIGRNNRQNDVLSFRVATDYDLWFHTQEIAGSHGLLRVPPGSVADEPDLQFAADLTAYYSRARQSEQVPVVYTEPKNVYKPKGAKPGMVIYKHERILWGCPQHFTPPG